VEVQIPGYESGVPWAAPHSRQIVRCGKEAHREMIRHTWMTLYRYAFIHDSWTIIASAEDRNEQH